MPHCRDDEIRLMKLCLSVVTDDASLAKSEPGGSPGVASDSDSDDELLKPKEEVDSDREDSDEGKTFSFQPHYLYRNAINLVESPTGAAVVDSSRYHIHLFTHHCHVTQYVDI